MTIKYNSVCLFVVVLSIICNADAVFDITKYGAKTGGGDSGPAIEDAFAAACKSATPSTVLIPKGTFAVSKLSVVGPCKSSIRFELHGTLQAPSNPSAMSKLQEWISIEDIRHFHLLGGGVLDGQGQKTWAQKIAKKIDFHQPTLIGLSKLTDSTVEDITLLDSKMFQANVYGCNNITLQNVTVTAPYDSPNTDGIHIGRSSNVKVKDCKIATGDDCVSLGDGNEQVTITGVSCGPGHGIAIGSLGLYKDEKPVNGVFIRDCSLKNTENGLRIKTWRKSVGYGAANDIHFENIKLTNVTYPINIDQEYCPDGDCPDSDPPSKVKISKVSFKGITGTSATKQIVKIICSKGVPCEDVEIGDIHITYSGPEKPDPISPCANVKPKLSGKQNPPVCTGHPAQKGGKSDS